MSESKKNDKQSDEDRADRFAWNPDEIIVTKDSNASNDDVKNKKDEIKSRASKAFNK